MLKGELDNQENIRITYLAQFGNRNGEGLQSHQVLRLFQKEMRTYL